MASQSKKTHTLLQFNISSKRGIEKGKCKNAKMQKYENAKQKQKNGKLKQKNGNLKIEKMQCLKHGTQEIKNRW